MRPIPFEIPKTSSKGLRFQVDEGKSFYNKFHYHTEFQLTAIEKGSGILHGGNNMVQFKPGDVFLLGENLPHIFKNSPEYYTYDSPGVLSYSIFFQKSSFGQPFFEMYELEDLIHLLNLAKHGIKVSGQHKSTLFFQIKSFHRNKKSKAIIQFLSLLSIISESDVSLINEAPFEHDINLTKDKRLNDILNYTFQNQHKPIAIEEVAEVAGLSRSQFSRFFKIRTGKTYIEFLNELRVESACTLLASINNKIDHICYDVGFQNLSHFNRIFKRIKGVSPSTYRKQKK
jgi:AraC-like DNA-binding protein